MTSTYSYKTPRALEMAVRDAAKKSGQDINHAISNYYHDRFIERVFSEPEPKFVLKGGRSMLARTVNARYTLDTDFLYRGFDVEEAVKELKRIATIDLGDFLDYRFKSANRIVETFEYRDGYRVTFTPVLGGTKEMNDIGIDLVVGRILVSETNTISPASRLNIAGLSVYNYLIYPTEGSIADKVCATLKKHNGIIESSRVRDLVDLVMYVTTEKFSGRKLQKYIFSESKSNKIELQEGFCVPRSWYGTRKSEFIKSAREAHIPEEYHEIRAAEFLVKSCVDPAITGEVSEMTWDPNSLTWKY